MIDVPFAPAKAGVQFFGRGLGPRFRGDERSLTRLMQCHLFAPVRGAPQGRRGAQRGCVSRALGHGAGAMNDVPNNQQTAQAAPVLLHAPDQPPQLSHAAIRAIMLGILLAMFLSALEQTIVAPALPTIGRTLGDVENLSLGGDGLSARQHRGDAAVRQALRHPRPAADDADRRSSIFIAGSVACALAPNMPAADRGARAAGHRRRRHPAARADHHRRHGHAARAAALPELHRRSCSWRRASSARWSAAC